VFIQKKSPGLAGEAKFVLCKLCGYHGENRGTNRGIKRIRWTKNPVSIGVSGYLSIDPSPPYRMTEAANDIQLAAFFIGKSMT